jgi:hypothetical protein
MVLKMNPTHLITHGKILFECCDQTHKTLGIRACSFIAPVIKRYHSCVTSGGRMCVSGSEFRCARSSLFPSSVMNKI